MKKSGRSVLTGYFIVALSGCLFALSGLAWGAVNDNAPKNSLTAKSKKTLLVFGDSLSAAYGMDIDEGWVRLLETRLAERRPDWRVVNVSISGETTSGGLERLDGILAGNNPDLVLFELGANDGFGGVQINDISRNIDNMIRKIRQQDINLLLFEMRIPPNYGQLYTEKFQGLYQQLSKRHEIPMVPFFLDGVAGDPALTQPDGIHPLAKAQPRMLENVWPVLEPLLK